MPLSASDVATAYRLILERTPAPEEAASVAAQYEKLGTLRQDLLNSEEFQRKYTQIQGSFLKQIKPVLIHLQIPEAVDPELFTQLYAAEALQPATSADNDSFAALCTAPRPERRKLRYVFGDLAAGAGQDLGLPHIYLCTIAPPGPRIYRIYRAACSGDEGTDMSFGTYLEYSLDSPPHRLELDNGQIRRLAGATTLDSLGREKELLANALHAALAPEMLLGFWGVGMALAPQLAQRGFPLEDTAPPSAPPSTPDSTDADYTAALAALDKTARTIFDSYTAWDSYFYDVCSALLSPDAAPGDTNDPIQKGRI